MKDTKSICRNCGTALVWGQSRETGKWVSLEPDPDGTWVRAESKSCWKLGPDEATSLPRFLPHMFLCAKHIKAQQAEQTRSVAKPKKPKTVSEQLDLLVKERP